MLKVFPYLDFPTQGLRAPTGHKKTKHGGGQGQLDKIISFALSFFLNGATVTGRGGPPHLNICRETLPF